MSYAPYDKPRIVVVAIVEQGGFGAGSAGPIVRSVLEAYFGLSKPKDVANGVNNDSTANKESSKKSSKKTSDRGDGEENLSYSGH